MSVTCSWGAFLTLIDGWAINSVLYVLDTGKVSKVAVNWDTVYTFDSGSPAEAAFLNRWPSAVKVTNLG